MIPFTCRLRDATRTPIIRNEDVWEYAEALVGDYKPSLLKEPGPINVEHFLESYLGATVDYQDLYYEKGEPPIAGATVFNDEAIRVFDRANKCTKVIAVPAGTILIDNSTLAAKYKGYAAFTGLHEGGHFTMHPEVYRRDPAQAGLRETVPKRAGLVCCRRSTIIGLSLWGRRLTPEQNREHQANTFAAFAAMPRQTFIPAARELIRAAGFEDGIFVDNEYDWECDLALEKLCTALSELYGTSYTAVEIHLRQLNLVMNSNYYRDLKEQGKLPYS